MRRERQAAARSQVPRGVRSTVQGRGPSAFGRVLLPLVLVALGVWAFAPELHGAAFRARTDGDDQGSGTEGLPAGEEAARLRQAFEAAGIHMDYERGVCALDAFVAIRDELLEYVLCLPFGAVHESLFATEVDPEILNTALLTLGVVPGSNAAWSPKIPEPTEEELRAGVSPYDVTLPEGDGFYLYAAWHQGEESYFYRVEDLVRDLARGRTMERHRFVYLGSRMMERGSEREVVFAASSEGNLINLAFFTQGYTLVTPALESCVEQTIWTPNSWLLPEMRSPVLFLFSRERLIDVPEALRSRIPRVASSEDASQAGSSRTGSEGSAEGGDTPR